VHFLFAFRYYRLTSNISVLFQFTFFLTPLAASAPLSVALSPPGSVAAPPRAQSRAAINEHAEAGFQISVGIPDEVIELL
jgi:hypothetical protein